LRLLQLVQLKQELSDYAVDLGAKRWNADDLPFSLPNTCMHQQVQDHSDTAIIIGDSRDLYTDQNLDFALSVTLQYASQFGYHVMYYQYSHDSAAADRKHARGCTHPQRGPRAHPWVKLLAILHALHLPEHNPGVQRFAHGNPRGALSSLHLRHILYLDSDSFITGNKTIHDIVDQFLGREPAMPRDTSIYFGSNNPFGGPYTPNSGLIYMINNNISRSFFRTWWDSDERFDSCNFAHPFEQRWVEAHVLSPFAAVMSQLRALQVNENLDTMPIRHIAGIVDKAAQMKQILPSYLHESLRKCKFIPYLHEVDTVLKRRYAPFWHLYLDGQTFSLAGYATTQLTINLNTSWTPLQCF
jgi:hypothetical protein